MTRFNVSRCTPGVSSGAARANTWLAAATAKQQRQQQQQQYP